MARSMMKLKFWPLGLLLFAFAFAFLPIFCQQNSNSALPHIPIKGVNLGGWLVTEGWIKPSLFEGIPNKTLLDGTQLQFKSKKTGKFLSAESGGGTSIVANRTSANSWESFKLWRISPSIFRFRVFNNQFVGFTKDMKVVATKTSTNSEKFEIKIVETSSDDDTTKSVQIKTSNGCFVKVMEELEVIADCSEESEQDLESTVFEMTISRQIDGEFQVTNGYGPDQASIVMKAHWDSFIVEDDFKFISNNGLNAVRIPVGWWTAMDPYPPAPYVAGSSQVLDRAFYWAEKYGLKVILDLHAAPGAQSYGAHSSPRDGTIEWGKTDENIELTIRVIDILTARYANSKSLYGVELLNEPLVPGVTLESLIKYYKAGYEAVRKHSSEVYVVLSTRLSFTGPDTHWPMELFNVANSLPRSVIDTHWYSNYYCNFFNMKTSKENIDYIYHNRASQLSSTISNVPLLYIGEWSASWYLENRTKEEIQQFVKAKLEVYEQATFGWTYWTYKIEEEALEEKDELKLWSLKWLIENGYLKL